MRRFLIILLLALPALTQLRGADLSVTAPKAAHAYAVRDWPTAQAMYELMLTQRPDSGGIYARAIVASAMRPDSARAVQLVEEASAHGVSIYGLFDQLRSLCYELGKPRLYSSLLEQVAHQMPWLTRPVDAALLDFYAGRRNGPMMIEYARRMLAGMPESVEFLSALAQGQIYINQYDQAIKTWRQILALAPDHYRTLLDLGNLLLIQDKPDEAVPYLVRAYRLNPTPYVAELLRSHLQHLK